MQIDDRKDDFGDKLVRLAEDLTKLEPGPLALLRRMDPDGPGEGVFWALATRHDLFVDSRCMQFVRLLALLTPKGAPAPFKKLHVRDLPFGAALAMARYPETRLLRFLALPFAARGEALEPMVRWLASKGHGGLNTRDIARLLFFEDVKHSRRLAATYYATRPQQSASKDAIA